VKELGLQGFVALLLLTVAIMAVIYRLTYEQDMRTVFLGVRAVCSLRLF
jgi:hypothetical protein